MEPDEINKLMHIAISTKDAEEKAKAIELLSENTPFPLMALNQLIDNMRCIQDMIYRNLYRS